MAERMWEGDLFQSFDDFEKTFSEYCVTKSFLQEKDDPNLSPDHWIFDQEALQEYILICCQHSYGGLIDKPGKARDHYHTCYCLSGLSAAQHVMGGNLSTELVIGNPQNKLRAVQPVFNLTLDSVVLAEKYFGRMKSPVKGQRSGTSASTS